MDFRGTLFKLLNGVFRAKIFFMKVVLKYQINLFFKFVKTKTQLITSYYHLVLHKTLILHLHLFRRFKQSQHSIKFKFYLHIKKKKMNSGINSIASMIS